MGYTIGLDLGVASLGWAVVNDEYEVLESCSNIFPAAESANNVERRGFRQGRRLSRRRRTRISDFRKLWEKSGFEIPMNELNEVLKYRIKRQYGSIGYGFYSNKREFIRYLHRFSKAANVRRNYFLS